MQSVNNQKGISDLLTPCELEKFLQALSVIHGQGGWGKLEIDLKSGRFDIIKIETSILVRDRPASPG